MRFYTVSGEIAIIMKKILYALSVLAVAVFACEGDCYKCHIGLKNDGKKEHAVIARCVECHKVRVGRQPKNETCGVDCFECHTPEKIKTDVVEHKEIVECIKCHTVNKRTIGVKELRLNSAPSLLDSLR